jgi:hypothetical protein
LAEERGAMHSDFSHSKALCYQWPLVIIDVILLLITIIINTKGALPIYQPLTRYHIYNISLDFPNNTGWSYSLNFFFTNEETRAWRR